MHPLTDTFGRQHTYLRIAVTERCNFACRYCMPEGDEVVWQPKGMILTLEEIERIARIYAGAGVTKIRLTGGEPLVRRGIVDLTGRIARIPGVKTVAMTTNGALLPELANPLRAAGLSRINISLDSLQRERFEHITGSTTFDDVLRGIDVACASGFERIKINVVVMRGVNGDELVDFARFAAERNLHVRFIEYMPFLGNGWDEASCMPYAEMREAVSSAVSIVPLIAEDGTHATAKEFSIAGSNATLGFITTMTDDFCAGCNRLRITAEGKFRNCLFATGEVDLRSALRGGASDEDILRAINGELVTKWERHPEANELKELQNKAMIAIGG
jgi:cyclic pyranopterin phosphate synthase